MWTESRGLCRQWGLVRIAWPWPSAAGVGGEWGPAEEERCGDPSPLDVLSL